MLVTFKCVGQIGSVDTTFAENGYAVTSFGNPWPGSIQARSIFIQSNQKILVGGEVYRNTTSSADFALCRYDENGSLDTTFGNQGKLVFDYQSAHNIIYSTLQLSNGKILIGGSSGDNFVLCLLSENGVLDTSFGNGIGIVTLNMSGTIVQMKESEGGKIIVAGVLVNGTDVYATLTRLNLDLSFDNTFASNGTYIAPFKTSGNSSRFDILPDGKIVFGSTKFQMGNFFDYAVMKLNQNGTIDNSFGENGTRLINITDQNIADTLSDLKVQSDGKILLCGYSLLNSSNNVISLARLNANGSLDPNFGISGKLYFPNSSSSVSNLSVLSRDNNKIVIGCELEIANNKDYKLLFLNSDGSIDTNFGSTGTTIIDYNGNDFFYQLAKQGDGKILATGRTGLAAGTDFMTVRINVENNLGTNNIKKMEVKAYPNPFIDKVYINLLEMPDEISIYNTLGIKIPTSMQFNNHQLIIDCSEIINKGVYTINLKFDGTIKSLKIIK